ncbi:MAG: type II toxin-antitoxin system VapC family toxin [Candidatus Ranarchaeia archaeon]|jgi:rRNA-processing protein FCF1
MILVLLDTNILINQTKHPIDLNTHFQRLISIKYEIITITPILNELKTLIENAKSIIQKKGFILALDLAKKLKLVSYTSTKDQTTDEAIIEFARSQEIVVVTNDGDLRTKLHTQKTPVIYLRQRKKLELDGVIKNN